MYIYKYEVQRIGSSFAAFTWYIDQMWFKKTSVHSIWSWYIHTCTRYAFKFDSRYSAIYVLWGFMSINFTRKNLCKFDEMAHLRDGMFTRMFDFNTRNTTNCSSGQTIVANRQYIRNIACQLSGFNLSSKNPTMLVVYLICITTTCHLSWWDTSPQKGRPFLIFMFSCGPPGLRGHVNVHMQGVSVIIFTLVWHCLHLIMSPVVNGRGQLCHSED